MKQFTMFSNEDSTPQKYTSKIEAPIYEPKNQKPHVLTLCDDSKTKRLISEIDSAEIPDEDKHFLKLAAYRHAVFNYERIADYYAHSKPEIQTLMEKSALVIIDFEKAIENGFVKLCEEIKTQFMEEYNELA